MSITENTLSLRMRAVFDAVEPCEVLCDVGCDHGYVSIALAKAGIAKKVLACDVNKGPLDCASENIKSEGLSDRIECRLSDGLHNITTTDAPDCIVIAGMGGRLMKRILSEGLSVMSTTTQLVLQPQSEGFLIRQWIRENGYHIVSEKMVEDAEKFYWIIDARMGRADTGKTEEQDIFDQYSEYLIKKKDEVLKEYLENQIYVNQGYLNGISNESSEKLIKKIEHLKRALDLMKM